MASCETALPCTLQSIKDREKVNSLSEFTFFVVRKCCLLAVGHRTWQWTSKDYGLDVEQQTVKKVKINMLPEVLYFDILMYLYRSWAVSLLCGNGESGQEHNSSFALFPCLISLTVSSVRRCTFRFCY